MTPPPLRIVVADDEPDMRDYYARILPRLGHEVVAVVATGQDLVEQCRLLRPDLVITDNRMPDMDGLEATRLLCEDSPVPVILVTAHHDPTPGQPDHVTGRLVKPIRQLELAAAITQAVAGSAPGS